MNYKDIPVIELVNKCADKDPVAWSEFILRFSPFISYAIKRALLNYSQNKKGSTNDVNEVKQNIMFDLWSKNRFENIRNRTDIRFWLSVIARNAAINYLKSEERYVLISNNDFFEKNFRDKFSKAENTYASLERIKNLCSLLSARDKIIFDFYFKNNMKLKDISNIMKLPLGTTSSIVARIRERLIKFREDD